MNILFLVNLDEELLDYKRFKKVKQLLTLNQTITPNLNSKKEELLEIAANEDRVWKSRRFTAIDGFKQKMVKV